MMLGSHLNMFGDTFFFFQIEEILKNAKVKPACVQAESHPLFPNMELLEFCKKKEIAFVSFSPLGVKIHQFYWSKTTMLGFVHANE